MKGLRRDFGITMRYDAVVLFKCWTTWNLQLRFKPHLPSKQRWKMLLIICLSPFSSLFYVFQVKNLSYGFFCFYTIACYKVFVMTVMGYTIFYRMLCWPDIQSSSRFIMFVAMYYILCTCIFVHDLNTTTLYITPA